MHHCRSWNLSCAVALGASLSSSFLLVGEAVAQPPPESAAPAAKGSPSKKASPPAKEAPPTPKPSRPKDYDGREEKTTAGDVLLWVPRVILFPAYVVSEYVIRTPLGFVTRAAEKGRWIQEITNFFTFGPDNNIGIVPTALIDFGFEPSVGVYFFYDDFVSEGNDLRVHAATGGLDWLRLTVADRIAVDDLSYVKLRGEAWTRPDWAFFGIGPESPKTNTSRYVAKTIEGGFSFYGGFKGASSVELYSNVKHMRFADGTCCDEPSLRDRASSLTFDVPSVFDTGYTAYQLGAKLALDSRRPRPEAGSGVRLDLAAENAFDIEDPERRWIRYGGTLGGFLDITGNNRVVSLAVTAQFADPLGDHEVPFTELVSLGGDAPMRGYKQGRLLGRSAAVATLEYRYPIWAFLDGSLQLAVGNVFGAHLSDFDPDLLRLAWTAGVRTIGARDHSFDLLVGCGTETFKQGAGLNELRLLFGATRGF